MLGSDLLNKKYEPLSAKPPKLSSRKAVATSSSTGATVAEADARIMKQNRLLRAELASNPSGVPGLQVGQGPVDDSDDNAPRPPRAQKRQEAAKSSVASNFLRDESGGRVRRYEGIPASSSLII